MGNATEAALSGSSPGSKPGFSDGLGQRAIVAGQVAGETLEVLQLRPELTAVSSFEFALRERTARLVNFRHDAFARVRQIDRLPQPSGCLAVVSDHVDGWRLAEVLAGARERRLDLEINAALALIGQLVHAVSILHQQARGVAHGALALERVVVTPHARPVIVEHVLGSALERLEMTRERLWRDLRVAVPPAAGGARFDHRADVTQLGVIALALVMGRPLGPDDFPHRVSDLLASATENRTPGGRQPLSKVLRTWLARALQLDLRHSFQSAIDAEAGLDTMLAEESAYVAAPVALEAFVALYQRSVSPSVSAPEPTAPAQAVDSSAPAVVESSTLPSPATSAAPAIDAPAEPPAESLDAIEAAPPLTPGATFDLADLDAELAAQPGAQPEASPVADEPPVAKQQEAAAPFDGYPGGLESLMSAGTNDGNESDEITPASRSGRRRMLVRIAVGLGALVVLGGVGFFVLRSALGGNELAPTGTLVLESRPSGLAVRIDGTPRGKTPLKAALSPGRHRLELDPGTGGEARVIPITITAGSQVSQYIETATTPSTGRLQIASEPAGAIVLVDGEKKGTAPILVADLSAGSHHVVLQDNNGKVQQDVNIEAGGTSSIVVPMTRQTGPVSGWIAVATPVELQVLEDGQLLGTTASERILVEAGRHNLEIVNDTLGYRGQQSVQVSAGKVATVRVALPKGSLNINAAPWAEVWVDGQKVGETPIGNLSLTIGPHEIVFRHPQLGERRHAVTVTTRAPARVSVDLAK